MRRIPLSRRLYITGFQPLSTGTAEYESALERDFVVLSSFLDPHAVIAAQLITTTFQVAATWCLLARGSLCIDLSVPITPSSRVGLQ
jgi:hypothetical protein